MIDKSTQSVVNAYKASKIKTVTTFRNLAYIFWINSLREIEIILFTAHANQKKIWVFAGQILSSIQWFENTRRRSTI